MKFCKLILTISSYSSPMTLLSLGHPKISFCFDLFCFIIIKRYTFFFLLKDILFNKEYVAIRGIGSAKWIALCRNIYSVVLLCIY